MGHLFAKTALSWTWGLRLQALVVPFIPFCRVSLFKPVGKQPDAQGSIPDHKHGMIKPLFKTKVHP